MEEVVPPKHVTIMADCSLDNICVNLGNAYVIAPSATLFHTKTTNADMKDAIENHTTYKKLLTKSKFTRPQERMQSPQRIRH